MPGPWRPLTVSFGQKVWWRDNYDGTATILHQEDVEPVIERNHAMATHNDGWNPDKSMRRVGSIPQTLLTEWRNNKGINLTDPNHFDELRKLMNDSDYRKLRSAEWQV